MLTLERMYDVLAEAVRGYPTLEVAVEVGNTGKGYRIRRLSSDRWVDADRLDDKLCSLTNMREDVVTVE